MKLKNFGSYHQQIVKDFRRVLETHIKVFEARRDHVRILLGSPQNYQSGIYREGLLRAFLKDVLPSAVNIDTGFVYGFGEVMTSRQLDILIWDPRHPPVYRTDEFVIVPPESVIAVITVKTSMSNADIEDGVRNLMSLCMIDLAYRAPAKLPPIVKMFVSFNAPKCADDARVKIASSCSEIFLAEPEYLRAAIPILRDFDPVHPTREQRIEIERLFPRLFASIDDAKVSFVQGWGPPSDALGTERHGPCQLRRVPWLYAQSNVVTTPLEKMVFYALNGCYEATGAPAGALLNAWADLNPVIGMRIGDTSEIDEARGSALFAAESLNMPT